MSQLWRFKLSSIFVKNPKLWIQIQRSNYNQGNYHITISIESVSQHALSKTIKRRHMNLPGSSSLSVWSESQTSNTLELRCAKIISRRLRRYLILMSTLGSNTRMSWFGALWTGVLTNCSLRKFTWSYTRICPYWESCIRLTVVALIAEFHGVDKASTSSRMLWRCLQMLGVKFQLIMSRWSSACQNIR